MGHTNTHANDQIHCYTLAKSMARRNQNRVTHLRVIQRELTNDKADLKKIEGET